VLARDRFTRRIESSRRFRWWVLWTVLTGLFSVGFSITVLSVSLPRIADDLGSNTATVTWAITGPLLAFGVAGPFYGKAADLWGPRPVYLLGLAGAGLFAGCTALAWDAPSLVVFRVLSVAEGAATGPAAMALIMRSFAPEDRVKAMGWWSLVMAGAPVVGVVAGGPIVEHISWRWIFAAQVPATAVALALASLVLPRTERGPRQNLDVKGALTLSVGVTALLFALNRGPVWGWDSAGVFASFLLSPVAIAAFVSVERRADNPLLDLDYVTRRNFTFPIANQLFANFAYMGSFILTPLLLKESFGYGETKIGLLSIARPLTFSLTAPLAGYFTTRIGERSAAVGGSLAVAASMIALAGLAPGDSNMVIMGSLALAGIGIGLSSPAMTASVANSVDEEHLGIAGASQQLIVQVGVVAGIQLAQTVQHAREPSAGLVGSFGDAYLMLAAVAALGVVAAAFVRSSAAPRPVLTTP
jgi:DHA2 family methylenomycin A resistance protein-like MFS transporter